MYREFAPQNAALEAFVDCFWIATSAAAAPYRVLPDGCADVVFEESGGDRSAEFVGTNVLYLNVLDLEALLDSLEGLDLEVARRTTFYGATEVGVREPGGTLVMFAQHATPEPSV